MSLFWEFVMSTMTLRALSHIAVSYDTQSNKKNN